MLPMARNQKEVIGNKQYFTLYENYSIISIFLHILIKKNIQYFYFISFLILLKISIHLLNRDLIIKLG